jgi:chaperonin GroES
MAATGLQAIEVLNLERHLKIDDDYCKASNLVGRLTEADAQKIGSTVWDGYSHDKQSRMTWETRMTAAMDLAMQVAEAKTFPWPGCANVIFPLVTIAALQFSARAYPALIQGTDVVRYRVITPDPQGSIGQRATRIGRHMSWQVLEEDEAWEEQHDRLFINLAIVGSAFIKSYYKAEKHCNVSELVMSRDLVIDYYAKSVDSAMRLSHLIPMYRNEVYTRSAMGTFVDVTNEPWFSVNPPPYYFRSKSEIDRDLRAGQNPPPADMDGAFMTVEQHNWLDLDGDGYAEPYIATIEESSRKLLRLVARWEKPTDVLRTDSGKIISIKPTNYFTKFSFIPSPDGGIYDLGFGTFLGPINEAVSTGVNQLLDMGTMQNSIGGFLGRGAKIRGGIYTMAPWEWKRVDSTGDDLQKSLVPYPTRQPLDVTLKLIVLLIEYANRIAGTVETQVGENPGQNTPAETARTTNENGMQMFNMIFKRVWRSLKEEFKKLYTLNAMYLRTHQTFGPNSEMVMREDYIGDPDQIAPVANPAITSSTMKLNQAITLKQAAAGSPGYNRDEVEKTFLKALQIENVEKIYPGIETTGPLPNPKLQIEQLKIDLGTKKIEAEKQKWANALLADRPHLMAQIDLLKAQAAKIIADIGHERAALQIEAFEVAIGALQNNVKMNDERMAALQQKENGDGSKTSDTGGVPRLANPPGNSGVPTPTGGGGQGTNGAMGGGGAAVGGP